MFYPRKKTDNIWHHDKKTNKMNSYGKKLTYSATDLTKW